MGPFVDQRRVEAHLRILLAHSFYRIPGGEDRYVRQQAELLARDHTVELFSKRNDDLSASVTTSSKMLVSGENRREIARVLERFKPEIVHVHNVYPALGPAVHLASEEARIPLVMTVHNYRMRCPNGLMFTEGSVCHRCQHGNYLNAVAHSCFPSKKQSAAYAGALWLHRFVARLDRKVSLFVCPSDFVRDQVISWGIASKKAVVIPNFVLPRLDANATPGHYGVFVGRLASEKGVHVLLNALRIANDPPFKVVGDGPLASVLRRQAATIGLEKTQFMGRQPPGRVDGILRDARFLVLPSLSDENCPMAGLEAMALGRPLLVTTRGGLPELVREGTGLICGPDDPHDLAKGIERLMGDDVYCGEAGARGLAVSREEFGPETHLSRLMAAYGTLSGRQANDTP